MNLAPRIALVLAAVAVIVPLAIWLSATVEQEDARSRLGLAGPRYLERLADAERDLRDVAGRTPSSEPELILGRALLFGNRAGDAAELLQQVVRREPESFEGWSLLAIALGRADPAGARAARERARALSPLPSGP